MRNCQDASFLIIEVTKVLCHKCCCAWVTLVTTCMLVLKCGLVHAWLDGTDQALKLFAGLLGLRTLVDKSGTRANLLLPTVSSHRKPGP